MSFHDVRLPEEVEQGARGGPAFRTNVLTLESGFEKRNRQWSVARQQWDIGYGLLRRDGSVDDITFEEVVAFFYARNGRAFGFRFKDWTDFELTRQFIGTTDTTTSTFQIFKRYSSGGYIYDRSIKKPVSSTVKVWVDGVERSEGGGALEFQVDLSTGVITLGADLVALDGTDVECECEFDVPARFDVDQLQIEATRYDLAAVPQIPVIELLI